jgi:hypothetical protein
MLEFPAPPPPCAEAVLGLLSVELVSFNACSIDPVGCTDVDDALHARVLQPGLYEVSSLQDFSNDSVGCLSVELAVMQEVMFIFATAVWNTPGRL